MKLYAYGLAALILTQTIQSCSSSRKEQATTPSVTGNWQSDPIYVDGLDDDWKTPLLYAEPAEKIKYSISNDEANIYIRIATGDQLEQQKIIQGGMTIWINNQGQKTFENAVGIGYPIDSRNNREKDLMEQARPGKQPASRQLNLSDCHNYELYNFPKEEAIANYEYGTPNNEGVSVKVDFNKGGALIYEAAIPMASVYPKGNATGKSIAVGIFVEGIPGAPTRSNDGSGGGVSVGGGLGFGSFGSGGGLGLSIGSGSLARIGGKKNGPGKQAKIWQVLPVARQQKSAAQ